MNWTILIVCILGLVLVVFLIIRNQYDEIVFEEKMNNDYSKLNEDLDEDDLYQIFITK